MLFDGRIAALRRLISERKELRGAVNIAVEPLVALPGADVGGRQIDHRDDFQHDRFAGKRAGRTGISGADADVAGLVAEFYGHRITRRAVDESGAWQTVDCRAGRGGPFVFAGKRLRRDGENDGRAGAKLAWPYRHGRRGERGRTGRSARYGDRKSACGGAVVVETEVIMAARRERFGGRKRVGRVCVHHRVAVRDEVEQLAIWAFVNAHFDRAAERATADRDVEREARGAGDEGDIFHRMNNLSAKTGDGLPDARLLSGRRKAVEAAATDTGRRAGDSMRVWASRAGGREILGDCFGSKK